MGEKTNEYVLAMYDVRGKQDYIYRRNKIKEIVGASLIIRDCFKMYLYPAAEKAGGKGLYHYEAGEGFSERNFETHLEEGYIGEVIYEGGGNFFVLFKNHDYYVKANKIFYKKLFEKTGTLRVLTSFIEGVNFSNYKRDEAELRKRHRKAEQEECVLPSVNALPIVQVDLASSQPLVARHGLGRSENGENKVTLESLAKYQKYEEFMKSKDRQKDYVKKLDDLITKKGEDSHIAVVYIDGNSMGAKVEAEIKNRTSYEACVNALRRFSEEIQRKYIDKPKDAIDAYLTTLKDETGKSRFIIAAGDEITFLCNARAAFDVVRVYFESLPESGYAKDTSCAGIAIFHSHAPFDQAYRIAEECCENAKRLMKKKEIKNACLMDFHYIQNGINTSLEDIRKHEIGEGYERICLPWLFAASDDVRDGIRISELENMKKCLNVMARSNGKTLLQVAKRSEMEYLMELERVIVHCTGKEDRQMLDKNREFLKENRHLLYRMMLVYDLWFRKEKAEEGRKDK